MQSSITWQLKSFSELEPEELYEILRLRTAVFVVEQNCIFQDMDNKDQHALHLMGWMDGSLAAYTRLFDKGGYYQEASIGRVVTSPTVRGQGIGKALMQQAIGTLFERYGKQNIRIGAQCYLDKFYRSLGFVPEGAQYMEDGILHVEMVLKVS